MMLCHGCSFGPVMLGIVMGIANRGIHRTPPENHSTVHEQIACMHAQRDAEIS